MASIRKYKTAKGAAWRVQYRDPGGKSRTKTGFATKAAAERWAAKNTLDLAAGRWSDPAHQRVTVRDLHPTWETTKSHLKPATRASRANGYTCHVEPAWAGRRVGTIRASAAMTLDIYAALFDDDLDAVSGAMDGALEGVVKMSSNGRRLP